MPNKQINFILCVSFFLYFFLNGTGYTSADIYAERQIKENKLSMTTLDFTVSNSFNSKPIPYFFNITEMEPLGFALSSARVKKTGSLSFKYFISYKLKSGDEQLCNSIGLKVLKSNFEKEYEGFLHNLKYSSQISDSTPQDLILFISLEENTEILQNKLCNFDIIFKTYRNTPNEEGGIYASRQVQSTISTN